MYKTITTEHFERISFHDCVVYGLIWESNGEDWDSELILIIDYIDEWLCDSGVSYSFKVAPATLVFHNVTNLNFSFNTGWGDRYQNMIDKPAIQEIRRKIQTSKEQLVHLDRDYSVWEVIFDSVGKGGIKFGATGFSLMMHEEPGIPQGQQVTQIRINDRVGLYYRDCCKGNAAQKRA